MSIENYLTLCAKKVINYILCILQGEAGPQGAEQNEIRARFAADIAKAVNADGPLKGASPDSRECSSKSESAETPSVNDGAQEPELPQLIEQQSQELSNVVQHSFTTPPPPFNKTPIPSQSMAINHQIPVMNHPSNQPTLMPVMTVAPPVMPPQITSGSNPHMQQVARPQYLASQIDMHQNITQSGNRVTPMQMPFMSPILSEPPPAIPQHQMKQPIKSERVTSVSPPSSSNNVEEHQQVTTETPPVVASPQTPAIVTPPLSQQQKAPVPQLEKPPKQAITPTSPAGRSSISEEATQSLMKDSSPAPSSNCQDIVTPSPASSKESSPDLSTPPPVLVPTASSSTKQGKQVSLTQKYSMNLYFICVSAHH